MANFNSPEVQQKHQALKKNIRDIMKERGVTMTELSEGTMIPWKKLSDGLLKKTLRSDELLAVLAFLGTDFELITALDEDEE